jgi:hypothetical protein
MLYKNILGMITLAVAALLVGACGVGTGADGDRAAGVADPVCGNRVKGKPHDTKPTEPNEAILEGVGTFKFDPKDVKTVRRDIFKPGYFSVFDVLVHLASMRKINLEYHFDESADTHIVDTLNGAADWWYEVWYEGGWPEKSYHRMDYYPVKDKMHISFRRVGQAELERRYGIWRKEVRRRRANGGKVVIPEVRIEHARARQPFSENEVSVFENVEVRPHNLRADMFAEGVVTATDVIMSLGDQGKINYEVWWYDRIGIVEVKDYFVECIDNHPHSGMCGFVYDLGEKNDRDGNHIHAMTDIRVLQSPEYVLFFWIELGPCE